MIPGSVGQFEIYVDGKLVAEKEKVSVWSALLGNRGIPSSEKVLKLLEGLDGPGCDSP